MTEPDYIMPELMPKDFEDGKPKAKTFFWLGDPHNRYMTKEEYDEAVLAFRSGNNEGPEEIEGVLRTLSRRIVDGQRISEERIDVV